jgi:acylphosphatase
VHLKIKGKVQGVFYRQSTKEKARSLGISGWVRNTDDGSVEIEAFGLRQQVESLIAWCWQGPDLATVTSVIVEWQDDSINLQEGIQQVGIPKFEVR